MKVWKKTHGFTLPEGWLLVPSLQKLLWSEVNSDPPKLDIILLEGLRQQGCTNKGLGQTITSYSERGRETRDVISEYVSRPSEVFLRLRALFCTVSYVSIRKGPWFTFQDAIFMSDKIYKFTTQSYGGMYAPTTFYVTAWASTINVFSEKIRIQNLSLAECVNNTGIWEHFWNSYSPPVTNASTPAGSSAPDLPKDLSDQLRRAREDARVWKEKADRYRNERDRYDDRGKGKVAGAFGKGDGKNKNKNGNGNGKGKGKHDQGTKRNYGGDQARDPRQRPY